ncbi:MAG: hypothetical protein ACFFAI_07635 [Promethearchaeota archaeon]
MLYDDHMGYHMMDWNFDNWIFFILIIGILVFIGLIFVYYILNNTIKNDSNSRLKRQTAEELKNNNNLSEDLLKLNEEVSYCYNCGKKIDDRSIRFCPYCGAKI